MKKAVRKECTAENRAIKKTSKQDETEYLLASPANRRHILKSIQDIKEGRVVNAELIRL